MDGDCQWDSLVTGGEVLPVEIYQFVRFEGLGNVQSLGDLEQSDPWWRPDFEAFFCG